MSFKLLVLAGSEGISYSYKSPSGKLSIQFPDEGESGNVVVRLVKPIPKNKNIKLFFDN